MIKSGFLNSLNEVFSAKTANSGAIKVIDCSALAGDHCSLPLGEALLSASFTRDGNHLEIETKDHQTLLLRHYFQPTAGEYPTLISATGQKISGSGVATLTRAESFSQYAGPVEASGSQIGVVEKLEGSVTVKRGGAEMALQKGDSILQNDVVQTAKDGKIGITFNDKSVFTLGSDARMTLDKFVYDGQTGEGESSINVIKGMFKFVSGEIAANNPGDMKVETPVATIGIRGTTGGGTVEGEGHPNQFYLEPNADGTVGWFDVTTSNGTVSMNQPNMVVGIQSFEQAPPPPAIVSPQQLHEQFSQIIDFSPAGKYDAREESTQDGQDGNTAPDGQQQQGDDPQQTQDAQPNEATAQDGQQSDDAGDAQNAAANEEANSTTDDAGNTDGDTPNDNADANAANAGENSPTAANHPITMTLSGENPNTSAFDQAQMTLSGQVNGLSVNPATQNQPIAGAQPASAASGFIAPPPAASTLAPLAPPTSGQTLQQQVDQNPDALVSSVLQQQNNPTSPNTPPPTTSGGTSDPTPTPTTSGGDPVPPPPPPPPPAPSPITLTLTTNPDTFNGTNLNDLVIVDAAATLSSVDTLHGSGGIDTMQFAVAASLVGASLPDVTGFERIVMTSNSALTIDQAFHNANHSGAGEIEVIFGNYALAADFHDITSPKNIRLNGSGVVTFASTTAPATHAASNISGTSLHLDLSTNGTRGMFLLEGGSQTVSGGSLLGLEINGGTGHAISIAPTSYDYLTLNNLLGTTATTITQGVTGANRLSLELMDSNNVSGTLDNLWTRIHNSSNITLNGSISTADQFELSGSGSNIMLNGGGYAAIGDQYYIYDFSGSADITANYADTINLYNFTNGMDLTLGSTTNNATINATVDFQNLSHSLSIVGGDTMLALSANGGTVTLTDIVNYPFIYHTSGSDYIAPLGLFAVKDDRNLSETIYHTAAGYTAVNDSITGSDAETIEGSVLADGISVDGSNKTIYGYDGNDDLVINGNASNNTVSGGGGNDRFGIAETISNTFIVGGNGFDYIDASGLTNSYQLTVTGANITVFDGANTTTLVGSYSSIEGFIGGAGTDTFTATGNNMVFNGGEGSDTFTGNGLNTTVSYATSGAGVVVNLLGDPNTGGDADGDTLTDISYLIGSSYNDFLTGNALANSLSGGVGNDYLVGDAGSDTLIGGAGNDTLDGGTGTDLAYYLQANSGITATYNNANGTIIVTGEGTDTLSNIEVIKGTNYNDILQGGSGGFDLWAEAGDDILILDNTVHTSGTISGGEGTDTLKILDIGAQDLAGLSTRLNSIEHIDVTEPATAFALGYFTTTNAQSILGGSGNDTLYIDGSGGDDTITLGGGNWISEGVDGDGYSVYHSSNGDITVALKNIVVS